VNAVGEAFGEKYAAMRRTYELGSLDQSDLGDDPIAAFHRWFDTAQRASVDEPNAMTLATVDGDGLPDARAVLLKGADERGFAWYTNYESEKGRQLEALPFAALVFRWAPLERQVRVRGPVSRTSADESDAYFATRPVGSRVSAIVSPQSRPIADRSSLESEAERLTPAAGADGLSSTLARPPYWGGYRLNPLTIEFWQGRSDRLHDRLQYRRETLRSPWTVARLAP
jgi:pyridoxamine 5'-phosphate oxidase